jgi:glutamine cyclotransferase
MVKRQAAWLAVALAACGVSGHPDVLGFQSSPPRASGRIAAYSFEVVGEYVRPRDAYTQGLALHRDRLFESTGLYGASSLRETMLADGTQKVVRSRPLPDDVAL